MKRIPVRRIGVAVLLAAGFLASSAASHEQASRHKQCSLRTLEGFYLFAYSGYQIVDGQQIPFVFSGRDRLNGDGTISGVNSFSINGAISQNVTYTGTYTVNPDCTGTSTTVDDGTGETGHFDLFFGPDGDEVAFVQTDPGFVTGSIERRVSTLGKGSE